MGARRIRQSKSLSRCLHYLVRPALRRTPSVEPCAEAGEHFGHVADQFVVDLALLKYEHPASSCTKNRVNHLEAETREAFAVLDNDEAKLWPGQCLEKLRARRVETGPHFGDDLVDWQASALRVLEQAQLLPIQNRHPDRGTRRVRTRWSTA